MLILHGASGVDGRGAFYAKALNDAGLATLEITMFPPSSPPREGVKATMPHAAAALKWLAAQPAVDGQRLGIMGFSWGGIMSVLMSSELVQERLGKEVPRPVAFAPFYPCCSLLARMLVNPKHAFYNAHTRMSGSPMLIQVGTRDDYEEGEHACDALVAMWPAAARAHTTVHYVEGATHDFDSLKSGGNHYAKFSHGGHGGMVSVVPSPKEAAASALRPSSAFSSSSCIPDEAEFTSVGSFVVASRQCGLAKLLFFWVARASTAPDGQCAPYIFASFLCAFASLREACFFEAI